MLEAILADKITPHEQIYDSHRLSVVANSNLSMDEISAALPTFKSLKSSMYRQGKIVT